MANPFCMGNFGMRKIISPIFLCFNKLIPPQLKLHLPFQVPATRLKRFAESAAQEASEGGFTRVSAGILRAGRVTEDNLKNAERDLLAVCKEAGLTLPINLSSWRFGLLHIHHIPLRSWFQYLLQYHSELLLGGFKYEDIKCKLLLKSFWNQYKVANGDHWVFDTYETEEALSKCIPYYFHLDEGTGLRKSAVLVFNIQSLWGSSTAERFQLYYAKHPGRSEKDLELYMLNAQFHNQRGSSLLSRFLVTILPKKWYTKKFSHVYDKVLEKLATQSVELASNSVNGFFFICLGIKADAPAMAKAGSFTRSFLILGC